jgi:hypothetical protein
VTWAHSEIEYVSTDGPSPGSWSGLAEIAAYNRQRLEAQEQIRVVPDECRQLDAERVLVLGHLEGRGKSSGLDVVQVRYGGAHLFHVQDQKATGIVEWWDRDRAFVGLGLNE